MKTYQTMIAAAGATLALAIANPAEAQDWSGWIFTDGKDEMSGKLNPGILNASTTGYGVVYWCNSEMMLF